VRARLAAAHLLGCLASPWLLAAGHHSASPVYPSWMHAQVLVCLLTQGTSHWGHPLGESNAPPGPVLVAGLVADEDSLIYFVSTPHACFYVHLHMHMCTSPLRLVSAVV
jgi:hypothetical protein